MRKLFALTLRFFELFCSLCGLRSQELLLRVNLFASRFVTTRSWLNRCAKMVHHRKVSVAWDSIRVSVIACTHIALALVLIYGGFLLALDMMDLKFDPTPIIDYIVREIKGQPRANCLDKLTDGTWKLYPKCIEIFARGPNQT